MVNLPEWVWGALVAEEPDFRLDGAGPTAAEVVFASVASAIPRKVRVGDTLELADEWFTVDHVAADYVVLRSQEGGGFWIHDEFSEPLEGRLRWPWQS